MKIVSDLNFFVYLIGNTGFLGAIISRDGESLRKNEGNSRGLEKQDPMCYYESGQIHALWYIIHSFTKFWTMTKWLIRGSII